MFEVDPFASLGVLGILLLWGLLFFLTRRSLKPVIPYSCLKFFEGKPKSFRQKFASLPSSLLGLALLCLLAAMANPRYHQKKEGIDLSSNKNQPPVIEGLAIYLILDQSGSMAEKAEVSSFASSRASTTKLNLLKQVTQAFILGNEQAGLKGRPSDMIGLVAFARTAQVLSPLTLDHKVLIDQLNQLDIMRIKDQDGTGIGYAIYKTANLIAATRHFARHLKGQGKPAYEIKDSVMILVTDGMQDPNPLDQSNRFRWMDPEQAAAFAKQQNIRLYVINIDPEFTKPEWQANRKQMQRMAESTGGRFYALSSHANVADIYKEIDTLEKSSVPLPASTHFQKDELPRMYKTIRLYPYLIGFSMIFLAFSLVLQTTWLRTVP